MNPRLRKRAVDLVDLPMTPCYVSPLRGLQSSLRGGCGRQPDVGAMMPPKSENMYFILFTICFTYLQYT